jgi:hypothetical protein
VYCFLELQLFFIHAELLACTLTSFSTFLWFVLANKRGTYLAAPGLRRLYVLLALPEGAFLLL